MDTTVKATKIAGRRVSRGQKNRITVVDLLRPSHLLVQSLLLTTVGNVNTVVENQKPELENQRFHKQSFARHFNKRDVSFPKRSNQLPPKKTRIRRTRTNN